MEAVFKTQRLEPKKFGKIEISSKIDQTRN
jgi:hypothetical protein